VQPLFEWVEPSATTGDGNACGSRTIAQSSSAVAGSTYRFGWIGYCLDQLRGLMEVVIRSGLKRTPKYHQQPKYLHTCLPFPRATQIRSTLLNTLPRTVLMKDVNSPSSPSLTPGITNCASGVWSQSSGYGRFPPGGETDEPVGYPVEFELRLHSRNDIFHLPAVRDTVPS